MHGVVGVWYVRYVWIQSIQRLGKKYHLKKCYVFIMGEIRYSYPVLVGKVLRNDYREC